jgi:DNA topoisomerase III
VPFRARGVRVLDPGWTVLYPRKEDEKKEKTEDDRKDEEQNLPEFRVGETGPHEPFDRRGETTPPKSYTENTLLGAMETAGKLVEEEQLKEALKERGLGTPATRAAIIETLIERGYITRDRKTLAATDLGRYLVAIVRDRSLKSPELTGDWEARLRQVERGALDRRVFMADVGRYTEELIRSGAVNDIDPSRLGDCPRCGRPVIEGKRGYGCSAWRDGCPFVLWREYKGHTLTEDQIRELLQRRVLLEPLPIEGTGAVILQLMDSGDLAEIPVPTAGPRQGRAGSSRGGRTSRRTPGRRAAKSDRPAGESHDPEAPKARVDRRDFAEPRPSASGGSSVARPTARSRSQFGEEQVPRTPSHADDRFGSVPLGTCPLCGSDVVEQEKSFGCSGWRQGCRFAIWKTIAGKSIGARTAQGLLRRGRTPLLRGFRSRGGNRFDARLRLDGGEVRFEFDGDDRRRPPSTPDTV